MLTKGMRHVGPISSFTPRHLLSVARKALPNHQILVSFLCMAVQFIGFLTVLSWADLSFVFPATALVYVMGTLTAKVFLEEKISLHRWAGTMLVCVGVGLVSLP